jgi:hypothetical protein
MLRILMLLLIILCAQFTYQSNIEHKVLSEVSSFPTVFRIDDNFNRSFASIPVEQAQRFMINNESWRVKKYFSPDLNVREELNIKTLVNSKNTNGIHLGANKNIKLSLVIFKKGNLLVLKNHSSNEYVELVPFIETKLLSQEVAMKSSSIQKEAKSDDVSQKNEVDALDLDLVFIEARIPRLSKKPIYNNAINGRINVNNGEIDNGELVFDDLLKIGTTSIEPIEFNYVNIKNGGQITFEYMGKMVSGIFSKGSKNTYMMRVATGFLAGASFIFAKENSAFAKKTAAILRKHKEEENRLVKERSLASRKALERSGYNF